MEHSKWNIAKVTTMESIFKKKEYIEGDWQVLDRKLSPRMLKSNPGRNQRWKEEDQGHQEARGQGHLRDESLGESWAQPTFIGALEMFGRNENRPK